MKTIILLASVAMFAGSAASAQDRSKTSTYDGPNVSGSRTVVANAEAGTLSRDATATRKSDGAVATREYDRARTDTGVTASGSSTNFAGETRSFDYARTKTETGATSTGTATGRNGETYTLAGDRTKSETGYTANQSVTNSAGVSVYSRSASANRVDGQVSRSVTSSRPQGTRAPRAVGQRAGRRGN